MFSALVSVFHSVLMLDEAHERTLYTDIAIGLLKKVPQVQNISQGVKLVVIASMSHVVTLLPLPLI